MAYLITAVIKPFKLDAVKDALKELDILGMTLTEVQGYGRQGGKTEAFRGAEYRIDFVPKVKVEVIVALEDKDEVVAAIRAAAFTGTIGDGKIWGTPLDLLMRVRTGELGDEAL